MQRTRRLGNELLQRPAGMQPQCVSSYNASKVAAGVVVVDAGAAAWHLGMRMRNRQWRTATREQVAEGPSEQYVSMIVGAGSCAALNSGMRHCH